VLNRLVGIIHFRNVLTLGENQTFRFDLLPEKLVEAKKQSEEKQDMSIYKKGKQKNNDKTKLANTNKKL